MARTTASVHRLTASLMLAAQLAASLPAFAVTPAPAGGTAAHPIASTVLRRAQNLYKQGLYDDVVTTLYSPVNGGTLKGTNLRDARVLMARAYVKKGLTSKARDLFGAVLAAEPAFVLDETRADAEEIAVFNSVKPQAPPAAPARPSRPEPKPETKPVDKPAPGQPNIGPVPNEGGGSSWLGRHKVLTAVLAVGTGSAAMFIAGSGGSSGKTAPPEPLPGFPRPPH